MEFHSTNVIQMPEQCEKTPTEFIVPHFNFVIIASGNDEGFVEVKVDTADGTIVFLEAVDDGANSIIPPDIMMREWEQ